MKQLFSAFLCTLLLLTGCAEASGPAKPGVYGPEAQPGHIRFYNGTICTFEHGTELIEGELWTEGNKILYAGPKKDSSGITFDMEIDLEGDLVLPGFKNAHAHSPMTFLRSSADDLPLDQWLNEQVYPMEAKLTNEDVYTLYQLAVLEYLSGGITTAFDMYFFVEDMCRAAVDMGFRGVFCSPFNDYSSSIEEVEQQYLTLNAYDELITYHLGFHGEYTTSQDRLRALAALSEQYKAPVYFHNSETTAEVTGCVERHGATPTAYLDSLGLFNHGGGAFHCVHVTQEDLAIMRERGIGIVTNPASNCKLASGIAPVTDMLDAEITVAIGTDGPASNNALDMFREMYLASMLQKLITGDASALPAEQALELAAVGGARVMGLEGCTSLAPGMLADLVVISLDKPNMQPVNAVLKNLVYAGGKQNVRLTMVNGRILYENGTFYVGRPAEEIYSEANKIVERMKVH